MILMDVASGTEHVAAVHCQYGCDTGQAGAERNETGFPTVQVSAVCAPCVGGNFGDLCDPVYPCVHYRECRIIILSAIIRENSLFSGVRCAHAHFRVRE